MPKRPVDVFAGPGSLADKLRKRREAIEGGDPSGGRDPQPQPEKKEEYNHPGSVIKRGYYIEKD